MCSYLDLVTGECFKSESTDDDSRGGELSPDDYIIHEQKIVDADAKEISAFVENKVFKVELASDVQQRKMDCIWVRRWKRIVDNHNTTWIIKSRLCARGYLDAQKWQLTKSSTTATRLSQKLVLSHAALNKFVVETLDVSNAFLKGVDFANIKKMCKELAIPAP